MATEVTKRHGSTTLGPSMQTKDFSDLLGWHLAGVERFGDVADTSRPPQGQALVQLRARHHELQCALDEGARDRRAIALAVADLMLGYLSTGRMSEGEAKAATAVYVKALEDRPAWAVRRTCDAIARGDIEGVSLDFPPAAPRLRDCVNRMLEPMWAEQAKIREVLHAIPRRPVDPEMKAKVAALFTKLVADLKCDVSKRQTEAAE